MTDSLNVPEEAATYKLLIVDELGFVPLSKTGAELVRLQPRYERGSTLVTTNLPFDDGPRLFGSERLTGGSSIASPTTQHPRDERRQLQAQPEPQASNPDC